MITLTADWHCHNYTQHARTLEGGVNSRLKDILDCLLWIAHVSKEAGSDTLIVAGDVFHTRKSVEHGVLDRVWRLFRELEDVFGTIYVVAGNHDYSVTGDGSLSITALESEQTKIITEPCIETIDDELFGFIPYTEDEGVLDGAFSSFGEDVRYVVAHLGILGGNVGPSDFEVPGKFAPEDLAPERFDWIFLGHFHKHQEVCEGIEYLGSPLQLTWGERDETKGFVLLDAETAEVEFVENDISPEFVLLNMEEAREHQRPHDFVRVVVEDEEERAEAESLVKEFTDASIELTKSRAQVKARLDLQGKGDREILEAYVCRQPLESLENPKLLVDSGMDFLSKVD